MIAMQYSFVLPADYDMAIIDRRIAEKGRFTDGLPGLLFKAYLSSRRADGADNRYAPFYLWTGTPGMNDFLSGPGFAAVSGAFGRPTVRTWSVWHAELGARLAQAHFATRAVLPIAEHADLGALRAAESAAAMQRVQRSGAVAALVGYDPASWTLVRFTLWEDAPAEGGEILRVGHLSQG